MTGLLDRLAELARDGQEWNADFRAGQFTPAYADDGWPVELHGLVAAHDELCAALPTLLRIAHAAEEAVDNSHGSETHYNYGSLHATVSWDRIDSAKVAELRSALASLGDTPT